MLAVPARKEGLTFPLLASLKLDGIRAMVYGGKVWSRKLLQIPSTEVQTLFGHSKYDGFDGELVVGPNNAKNVFQATTSVVMSDNKPGDVTFFVFDHFLGKNDPFVERIQRLTDLGHRVEWLEQKVVRNHDELDEIELKALDAGYEGLVLRDPYGPYKYGRSTLREGWMLKLKRFADAEGRAVGFVELFHNANEAQTNELGLTKRSTHQANKIPMDTLGAVQVDFHGEIVHVGTGFTELQRREIWQNQSIYLNKLLKFKYFPVGIKHLPRHPVFLGWRDARDL